MKIVNVRAIPMSAPNCHILEVSQGYMPMMNELFNETYDIRDGTVHAPELPVSDSLYAMTYSTASSTCPAESSYSDGRYVAADMPFPTNLVPVA